MNKRQAKKVLRRSAPHRLNTLQRALAAHGRLYKRVGASSDWLWRPKGWTAAGYYGRRLGFLFVKQPRIVKT